MGTQPIPLSSAPLNFNQLLKIVRQLSTKEKLELESMIWNETGEKDIDISPLHKEIVSERLQKMSENPSDCRNWEEIECNLRLHL
ncbi:MAG: addiction module protein [Tannerellaceae bacterium]|jgi:hypothetical protein|nr:addiction module protein [Tannerellaceae bacterium]